MYKSPVKRECSRYHRQQERDCGTRFGQGDRVVGGAWANRAYDPKDGCLDWKGLD